MTLLVIAAAFIVLVLLGVYDVPYDTEVKRRRDDDPLRPRIYKLEERDGD